MNINQAVPQSNQISQIFMLNVTEILTRMLKLSTGVVIVVNLFTGCVIDRDTPMDNNDSPVCDESMSTESAESRADELCAARGLVRASDEECSSRSDCEEVMVEMCGASIRFFCDEEQPPVECSLDIAIDLCNENGLIQITEEECGDDPSCRIIMQSDECGDAIAWCRDISACPEIPRQTPEEACEAQGLELTTRESCEGRSNCEIIVLGEGCVDAEEVFCHLPEECDDSGAIDPNDLCGAEGLVLASQEECEAGDACTTITTEGPCGLSYDTLCRSPEMLCDAVPMCPEGLAESGTECRRGELGCTLVSECDQVISCRPEIICDLAPTCDDDEVESRFGCETDEENCRAVEECGETIFCRPQELCRAVPTCLEGRVESPYACLATESEDDCRSFTICGETIICR